MKANELTKGGKYYSVTCGHRHWYYTGKTLNPKGYPYWGNTTVYVFEDICDCISHFTEEEIEKYLEKA